MASDALPASIAPAKRTTGKELKNGNWGSVPPVQCLFAQHAHLTPDHRCGSPKLCHTADEQAMLNESSTCQSLDGCGRALLGLNLVDGLGLRLASKRMHGGNVFSKKAAHLRLRNLEVEPSVQHPIMEALLTFESLRAKRTGRPFRHCLGSSEVPAATTTTTKSHKWSTKYSSKASPPRHLKVSAFSSLTCIPFKATRRCPV